MESILKDCSAEEREVFARMARGELAENLDPEIIQRLLDKNLLGDHSGYIMIPAIVMKLWQNETNENPSE